MPEETFCKKVVQEHKRRTQTSDLPSDCPWQEFAFPSQDAGTGVILSTRTPVVKIELPQREAVAPRLFSLRDGVQNAESGNDLHPVTHLSLGRTWSLRARATQIVAQPTRKMCSISEEVRPVPYVGCRE